jgi:UDP-N-acetylglucosamine:LPS N-acetylglucosamine transferase
MRAKRPYWFWGGSLGARRMNQLIEKELRKLFRKMFRLFGNVIFRRL